MPSYTPLAHLHVYVSSDQHFPDKICTQLKATTHVASYKTQNGKRNWDEMKRNEMTTVIQQARLFDDHLYKRCQLYLKR